MELPDAVVEVGWLHHESHAAREGVRPPRGISVSTRESFLGIDVGGTKIQLAHWTSAGIAEKRISTDTRGGGYVIDDIARAASELMAGSTATRAVAGVPAQINSDGSLCEAPNLPGWDGFSIAHALQEALGSPVDVKNDVHLAAFGEHVWTGARDLVFIAIGTGIGAGAVVDGRTVIGSRSGAGEIFDFPVLIGGRLRQLEDIACGPGLERIYMKLSGRAASTHEILDSLEAEPTAAAALNQFTRVIAIAVKAAHGFFDPEDIVCGGGLGSRPEVVRGVRGQLERLGGRAVQVRASHLGPYAATIGALALCGAADSAPVG